MLGSRGFIAISLLYSQTMTQQKLSLLSGGRGFREVNEFGVE
ncbi:hypothetical protein HanXRQr2_Chr05g0224281 [Helianthus annuus]|uniref:Uncharacterized protein n=1 Tax=Helianthus annuus TaxID=4232 RepID=A0A9K3J0Y6_HELAN|nr:hypothetical protein HanXRQr2_Chr05g0224281 [Helianthus annuus]